MASWTFGKLSYGYIEGGQIWRHRQDLLQNLSIITPLEISCPMSDDRYILDQLDLFFWESRNEHGVQYTDATSGVSQGGPTVESRAELSIAQTAFLDPLVDFPSAYIVQSPQSLVLVQGYLQASERLKIHTSRGDLRG